MKLFDKIPAASVTAAREQSIQTLVLRLLWPQIPNAYIGIDIDIPVLNQFDCGFKRNSQAEQVRMRKHVTTVARL